MRNPDDCSAACTRSFASRTAGVGEPDKPKRRNMTADVNLHPDWSRLDTDEGGRCDGGEHDGNVRPLCDILPREGRMLFRATERG